MAHISFKQPLNSPHREREPPLPVGEGWGEGINLQRTI